MGQKEDKLLACPVTFSRSADHDFNVPLRHPLKDDNVQGSDHMGLSTFFHDNSSRRRHTRIIVQKKRHCLEEFKTSPGIAPARYVERNENWPIYVRMKQLVRRDVEQTIMDNIFNVRTEDKFLKGQRHAKETQEEILKTMERIHTKTTKLESGPRWTSKGRSS